MPTDAPAQTPIDPDLPEEPAVRSPEPGAGGPPSRRWLLVHLATIVAAAVVLFWFNRNQWFFGDEWEFFVNRGFVGPALGLFASHNEHWSTIPIVIYVLLRDTVGIGAYWPYIGVLIAFHLTLAHLLWRAALRAGATPLIATVGTCVFALLGAGSENLLWAFQIGFVGSLLFGWAAALVVDRSDRFTHRDWWAVGLLLCSLMCSGIGVPAVAMVTLLALARARGIVRPLIVGGLPALAFLAWYFLAPMVAAPLPGIPPAQQGPVQLGQYVVNGVAYALSATTHVPRAISLAVMLALAIWGLVGIVGVIRGRAEWVRVSIALAGLCAGIGFFVLSGFGRGQIDASRYVYVAIAFAMPGLLVPLARLARPRWAQVIVACGLVIVLVLNVLALRRDSIDQAAREQAARETILSAADMIESGEHIISQQPDPVYNPDIAEQSMRRLIDSGALVPRPTTADGLAWARFMLQTRVDDAVPPGEWTGSGELSVVGSTDVTIGPDPDETFPPGCLLVSSTGPNSTLDLVTPDGPATLGLGDPEGGFFGLSTGEATRTNPAGVRQIWAGYPELVPVQVEMAAGTRLNLAISTGQSIVCGVTRS